MLHYFMRDPIVSYISDSQYTLFQVEAKSNISSLVADVFWYFK